MLFNSLEFLLFLPAVFLLYHLLGKHRQQQNLLLVFASYVFYGWWDWRFCFLLAISTLTDFLLGLQMVKSHSISTRKFLCGCSLAVNLGILGFFKYFNFFVDSWVEAFASIGFHFHAPVVSILLPVGISFYTFQTLAYSIDVYRGNQKPTRDFVAFAAFVSFFPQLVAGPIERARQLLPQFQKDRAVDSELMLEGLQQILWGFFKKMVIADHCALVVAQTLGQPESASGAGIFIGCIVFAFQIYGDFSGYSDIAIGTAKLFGFHLMTNFKTPFFSRDIPEFFNRWHISLMSWFREYLFRPLGGMRGDGWFRMRNVVIVYLLSGLWHGANWTFVLWGGYFTLFFIPHLFFRSERKRHARKMSRSRTLIRDGLSILLTFLVFSLSATLFFSPNLMTSLLYVSQMFFNFSGPVPMHPVYFGLGLLVIIEWITRSKDHPLQGCSMQSPLGMTLTVLLGLVVLNFYARHPQPFIYFQF